MREYAHKIPECCFCHMRPGPSGEFFRIVKSKEGLCENDFTPVAFLNPKRLRNKAGREKCCVYSVSLYSNYKKVEKMQKQIPELGSCIARVVLSPDLGDHIPAANQGTHCDWFPYKNTDLLGLFFIV